jgi:exopolysaccharide production protein ExoZ
MSGGRIASIQGLRAVAATMVLVVHAALAIREARLPATGQFMPSIPNLTFVGAGGVDLFFVISGFVMAHSLSTTDANPQTFLAARWLRIAPLFALVSATYLLLLGASPTLGSLSTTLTLLPVFDGPVYHSPLLQVGWSLGFEAAFYILVAVVLGATRDRIHLLLALTLAAALTGLFVHPDWAPLRLMLNPLQLEFALGILVWMGWRRDITRRIAAPALVTGILLFAIGVAFGLGTQIDVGIESAVDGTSGLARTWTWGVPAALIMIGTIDTVPRGRIATWLGRIGDASYSTYLTHPVLLALIAIGLPYLPVLHPVITASAFVVASTLLGLIVHAHVERPLLARLRYRGRLRLRPSLPARSAPTH